MSKEYLYNQLLKEVKDYAKNGGAFDKPIKAYPFYHHYRYVKRQPDYAKVTMAQVFGDAGVSFDSSRLKVLKPVSLERFKSVVEEFVDGGGDLTMPVKSLPFYTLLRGLEEKLNVSSEEVFKLAGLDLNREYVEFKNMVKNAKSYVKDGKLKLSHNCGSKLYTYFQIQADLLGISYFEYIAILTNLPANMPIIKADYLDAVRMMLYKRFPDGIVHRVKAGNKQVYYKLQNVLDQNRGQGLTTEELISMLGFKPTFPKPFYKEDKKEVNEPQLVSKIKALESKNGSVSYKMLKEAGLYTDVLFSSYDNNIGVNQFMQKHGINYKQLRFKRLETVAMPEEFRYDIYKLKEQEIAKIDGFDNLGELEKYYKLKAMAVKIHNSLVDAYTLSEQELKTKLNANNASKGEEKQL